MQKDQIFFSAKLWFLLKKHENEYTKEDREQQKKNAELEKTEGWSKLDYSERESKGYEHVCSYISNHEYNSKTKNIQIS